MNFFELFFGAAPKIKKFLFFTLKLNLEDALQHNQTREYGIFYFKL